MRSGAVPQTQAQSHDSREKKDMNLIQKIARVDWTVVEELQHVPAGAKGSWQEALRNEYAAYRKIHRNIAPSLPPRAALSQAIHNIQRIDPKFQPRYDAEFFFGGTRMSTTLKGDPLAAEIMSIAANGGGSHTPQVQKEAEEHSIAWCEQLSALTPTA